MSTTQRVKAGHDSAETAQELSRSVAEMMGKSGAPGVSLVVVNADSVLHSASFGLADVGRGNPTSTSTSYLWFSMSKLVTATAALRLTDEGRLDLDQPIGEVCPLLRAPGPVQPTMQHLLTHTAGLANPLPIRWVHEAGSPSEPAVLLRRVMGRRRIHRGPVGAAARYSNVGYLAAGEVMSAITGEPFEEIVRGLVLDPIGMKQTDFAHSDGTDPATGYVSLPPIAESAMRALLPGDVVGNRHGSIVAMNPFYVDGPAYGGVVGTVLDAARFMQMHLNDGEVDGVRVLQPATARRMRVLDHPGKPFDHAIGWFRRPTSASEPWVEHFGAGIGYWNVMRLYPDRGLGVAIMSNGTKRLDFEPVMSRLVDTSWG